MKRVMGKIIPGSLRVEITETTYVTIECGNCSHQQDAWPESKMPWCRRCGRQMILHQAADVENVTPIRRRP